MTAKPSISGTRLELDARQIAGVPTADWDEVGTWPDTSGFANDGSGAGSFRRFEAQGWGGTEPSVRLEGPPQQAFTFSGVPMATTQLTVFLVLEVIEMASHLGLWGSDAMGSPGNRNHHIFALSTGEIIYNRSLDSYDIISAAGVITAGQKYVIVARQSSTQGMMLRVNGVQVAVDAAQTAVNVAFSAPTRIGVIDDQITGGVGRVFGEKRFTWVSAHSGAASDSEIAAMEAFLGTRYGIVGLGTSSVQPVIANQETEYDSFPLGLAHNAVVSPWPDTSGNANDGIAVGSPPFEDGAWDSILPGVNFIGTGGQINLSNGADFAGEDDIIMFIVFRVWDASVGKALTGGSSFTNFRMLESFVRADGSLVLSFGTNEGPTLAVESAAGEITQDGTCYACTFVHSNAAGKLLRKAVAGNAGDFGAQIALNASATGNLAAWDGARLADIAAITHSDETQLAWVSLHLSVPPQNVIEQMETWLLETFCGQSAILAFPRDVLPERVTALGSPGAIKRRANAGLVQIRSITAIGWSWEEEWGLLRVSNVEHIEMMAFITKVWHSGEPFLLQHRLMPGSGIAPNGIGTLNVMVAGAGQFPGDSVLTDGWPVSTADCVVVGDVISIQGEPAVYMVTETADSDSSGQVIIRVNPPLRTSPANNAIVKTTDVEFLGVIMGRSRFEPYGAPLAYAGFRVRIEECLL